MVPVTQMSSPIRAVDRFSALPVGTVPIIVMATLIRPLVDVVSPPTGEGYGILICPEPVTELTARSDWFAQAALAPGNNNMAPHHRSDVGEIDAQAFLGDQPRGICRKKMDASSQAHPSLRRTPGPFLALKSPHRPQDLKAPAKEPARGFN